MEAGLIWIVRSLRFVRMRCNVDTSRRPEAWQAPPKARSAEETDARRDRAFATLDEKHETRRLREVWYSSCEPTSLLTFSLPRAI